MWDTIETSEQMPLIGNDPHLFIVKQRGKHFGTEEREEINISYQEVTIIVMSSNYHSNSLRPLVIFVYIPCMSTYPALALAQALA